MDWSNCVNSAVTGATSIVSNLTSNPNDQKKAVSAAKKAGKEAQKLTEKLYPSWDVKGTKELAEKDGITSRAEWKRARAEAGKEAYQEAYDEVWAIYVKAKDAEINAQTFQSSQEYLDHELAMAEVNAQAVSSGLAYDTKNLAVGAGSGGRGCICFALALVVSGSGLIYLLINLI